MKRSLILMTGFLLISNVILSQDAMQWRGQNRDGHYHENGLINSWPSEGPELLWHYDSLGEGHASAAIDPSGIIYTLGTVNGKGSVFSFSASGKLLWNTPYGEEWMESYAGPRCTPLINDGKLYIISAYANIVCLDAGKGTILWSVDGMKDYGARNIRWGVTENLLIEGDKLFCTLGGEKHNVVALNKNTGQLIWTCPGNGEVSAYCSPQLITFPERKILVTMTEKSILGIDSESGKKLWSHEQINKWSVHANTPLFHEGQLYCVSGYGYGGVMLKLSADGATIEKVWFNAALDNRIGGVVLVNGLIYGMGDAIKGLHCLDWNTGKEIAHDKLNNKPGVTISADGMIYVYDEGGEVSLFEPNSAGFKKVSAFKVPFGSLQHWAHPVIDKGKLYIRHGNSLMVYQIKK